MSGEVPQAVERAPWLFKKGNQAWLGRKVRRQRMEHLIQDMTLGGSTLVQFWVALYSGQSFMMKRIVRLPMTAEQYAVAQGTATPEQKAIAKKQKRFIVIKEPYYPTVEDMKEVNQWLSDRGFGKAPQIVEVQTGEHRGFQLVYRRWPVGVDPAAEPPPGERIIEGKATDAPTLRAAP